MRLKKETGKAIEIVRIELPHKIQRKDSTAMSSLTQKLKETKRYLSHDITTKINAVKLYRYGKDLNFMLRRYHIFKASLMRWNKQYFYICAQDDVKLGLAGMALSFGVDRQTLYKWCNGIESKYMPDEVRNT